MEPIEINLSRTKLFLVLCGSTGFVLACVFLLTQVQGSSDIFSLSFISIVSYAGILFFGGCGIIAFIKMFDNKPGLIVSDEGINDNSSGLSAGMIPWADIIAIREEMVQGNTFLMIDVADPEKYLNRVGGIKAQFMRWNMKMYGSPIALSSTALKYNYTALKALLHEELNKRD